MAFLAGIQYLDGQLGCDEYGYAAETRADVSALNPADQVDLVPLAAIISLIDGNPARPSWVKSMV